MRRGEVWGGNARVGEGKERGRGGIEGEEDARGWKGEGRGEGGEEERGGDGKGWKGGGGGKERRKEWTSALHYVSTESRPV